MAAPGESEHSSFGIGVITPVAIRPGSGDAYDDAARGRLRPVHEVISKLYRQMYSNTGIATDRACVSRANRWARLPGPAANRSRPVGCLRFSDYVLPR